MKAVFAIIGLIVVLGIVYGLAFLGIIPVKKMVAKNPALAKILTPLHLAPAKAKTAPVVAKTDTHATPATTDPQQQTLDAQKKQLADDRAQLDKDKAAFEAGKQQSSSPTPTSSENGTAPNGTATADTGAKLSAIYATMSPDDIASIFAKLPDPAVIQNLLTLDEGKAGKVMAAMPADRAARLSQQMMSHGPVKQAAAPAPNGPVATIP